MFFQACLASLDILTDVICPEGMALDTEDVRYMSLKLIMCFAVLGKRTDAYPLLDDDDESEIPAATQRYVDMLGPSKKLRGQLHLMDPALEESAAQC